MVITTRSKSKFTMLITAEVRDYFESLIKPLVTNESDTIDRVQTKTIDRVHYIGKPVFDTVSKQKVRSVIVNFKSWESRTFFYKACPRNYLNGKKKPGAKSFSVSLRNVAMLNYQKPRVSLKIIPQLHEPFVI